MIKRLVAWLLAAAVGMMQLMPSLAVIVYADEAQAVITASSVSGRPGETVKVGLSISNNPGINAFGIRVTYDTAALECTDIIYEDCLKNVYDPIEMPPANMKASPFRAGWAGGNSAPGSVTRFNGNEVFLTLQFKIMENAENGDYEIALSQRTPGETARYDDTGAVSSVPAVFESGTVNVTDEKHEYTGAVPDAPVIYNIGLKSFDVSIPSGNEYTYSASPLTDFSACVWYTETMVSPLLPNTAYYVYQRVAETDTTQASPASPAAIAKTNKYDISDIIESVFIGTDGTQGTVLTPVITYRDGFDENSAGTVYYNWLSADTSLSVSDKYLITADDADNGREIYLTVSAENCNGEISSNTVKAEGNAAADLELLGINVNGEGITGFSPERLDYEYPVSYESWSREPDKVYYIDALAKGQGSTEVSENGFSLTIDDPDISSQKDITVTITGNSGKQRVYTIRFIVEKCPHAGQTENIAREPSCTELGEKETVCSLCGKIMDIQEIPAIGHEFDRGEVTLPPRCENDGEITYSCLRCDETYTETIPARGHDWSRPVTEKEASCTEDGMTVIFCVDCGVRVSESIIPAFGHSFGAWQMADETTYIRVCTVCGTSESKTVSDTSHEHIFNGRTEVVEEPTCQSAGLQNVYCSVEGCSEFVPQEIGKAPHTPGEAEIEEPSCTAAGSSTISCIFCGTVLSAEDIPATGHSFTDYIDTATCTLPGVKEAQCDNGCGAVDSVPSPAKGHSYDSSWLSDSTGHWHLCTVCGSSSAAVSHSENSGIVTLPPASTSTGIKTYSCTVCGFVTRTETIPAESKPADPTPADPTPVDPTPVDPTPVDPTPGNPTPSNPTPGNPTPSNPTPSNPTPGNPTPSNPTPSNPTPSNPTPGNPTPSNPTPSNPTPSNPTPGNPTPGNPEPIYYNPIITPPVSNPPQAESEDLPPDINADSGIDITLSSELTDTVYGDACIRTKSRFFEHSAVIRVTNTADSEAAGRLAMTRLDNDSLICYAFDISVYNADNGSKMQLVRNGYITFELPVPQGMEAAAASIEVYHIPGGVPERIESEVRTDGDGNIKVVFTATEFSPYMFTAVAAEDISAGSGMSAGTVSVDAASPVSGNVMIPRASLPRLTCSARKRRYRILRKRRLDDSVFVY